MRSLLMMSLVSLAIALISGCDLLSGAGEPVDPVDPQDLQLLLEADWELFAIGLPESPEGLIDSTRITLSFTGGEGNGTEGTLNGSAGCNTFSGTYELTATSITIGPIGLTRMFCPAPDGIMDQEVRFVEALESAVSYELVGGQLDVLFGLGGERLYFIGALPSEME